ncbi:hypothetical protein OZ843_000341 [Yersinia enterocolitica]
MTKATEIIDFKNSLPIGCSYYPHDKFYIFPIHVNNNIDEIYSEFILEGDTNSLSCESIQLIESFLECEHQTEIFVNDFPNISSVFKKNEIDIPEHDCLYVYIHTPDFFHEIMSKMKEAESTDLGIDEIAYLNDMGALTGVAVIWFADYD